MRYLIFNVKKGSWIGDVCTCDLGSEFTENFLYPHKGILANLLFEPLIVGFAWGGRSHFHA